MDFAHTIGTPYHPINNNCWSFFRRIQHEVFGHDVPEIAIDGRDLHAIAKGFRHHVEYQHWQPVQTPEHGDAVLLKRARNPIHIGIWLQEDSGGVLHCCEGLGVVFQRISDLNAHHWHIEGYYHHG